MDEKQIRFQNRIIALCIIFSTIFGFIAGGLSSDLFNKISLKIPGITKTQQNQAYTSGQEERVVQVVKDSSPAVVSIIISKNLPAIQQKWDPFGDLFNGDSPFNFFFSPQQEQNGSDIQQEVGGGTGFVVRADGLILTNKHVVEDESAQYTVMTNDGQRLEAKVLARDPVQDIAIIKVERNNMPTLKLGDSDNIQIGQSVIAIGNALGELRNTVSVGVVSGMQRSVTASGSESAEQLENVIQTDAAINPGNSGGPLLNLSGEVIGINVAVAQQAQNIAFSLPINKAKRDIDQLEKFGKISYPYLGVRYITVTSDIQSARKLSVDYGALIQPGANQGEYAVQPGSPAEKMGLKENDIILEVDGKKIDSTNTLAQAIQSHNIGDTISLKVLSGGQQKDISLKLEERK